MCDLDRSDRVLAAAHAFQKILHVVRTPVELDFILARLLTKKITVRGLYPPPLNKHETTVPFKADPGWIAGLLDQRHPIGILTQGTEGGVHVKKSAIRGIRRWLRSPRGR